MAGVVLEHRAARWWCDGADRPAVEAVLHGLVPIDDADGEPLPDLRIDARLILGDGPLRAIAIVMACPAWMDHVSLDDTLGTATIIVEELLHKCFEAEGFSHGDEHEAPCDPVNAMQDALLELLRALLMGGVRSMRLLALLACAGGACREPSPEPPDPIHSGVAWGYEREGAIMYFATSAGDTPPRELTLTWVPNDVFASLVATGAEDWAIDFAMEGTAVAAVIGWRFGPDTVAVQHPITWGTRYLPGDRLVTETDGARFTLEVFEYQRTCPHFEQSCFTMTVSVDGEPLEPPFPLTGTFWSNFGLLRWVPSDGLVDWRNIDEP